jgi:hypothetical protein
LEGFVKRFSLIAFAALLLGVAGCAKNPTIQIPGPAPLRLIVANITGNSLLGITQPLGPASTPSMTLPGATGGFTSAHHISADAAGNLYMADPVSNAIDVFKPVLTSTSTVTTVIGPITGGSFPNSVSIDASGNLWVADGNIGDVYEFTPPFTAGAQAPNGTTIVSNPAMSIPVAPSFDRGGNMYVAQQGLNEFFVFTKPFTNAPTLSVPAAIESPPNLPPPFPAAVCGPVASAMDSRDRLFMACGNDGSVRVYAPPYATGNSQAFFLPPLVISGVQSFNAASLTMDASGNLYVAYEDLGAVAVYLAPISAASAPSIVLNSGLGGPFGLAFAP